MSVEPDGSVRHEVVVDRPQDQAFWSFTDLDVRTSEVEVTLIAEGEQTTRVTLVHRHPERHGAGWQSLKDGVDVEDGWPLYLARVRALTRDEQAPR